MEVWVGVLLSLVLVVPAPAVLARSTQVAVTPVTDLIRGIAQVPALGREQLSDRVEVWIDLEMPPLSAMPSLTADQLAAYRHKMDAAQSLLIEQLQRWGAEERARVQIVRNAVVVEVPESALEDIRKLPGVARVNRVTHRNRIDGPVTTGNR